MAKRPMWGTFSWFWIWAKRLYMQGGKRVMLTFPMSSALKGAFFASRSPRICEVRFECGEDVVVHRKRKALLDVPLDRIPHHAESLLAAHLHISAFHGLVDQLPGRVTHRAREPQEIREMDPETSVLSAQVHGELGRDVEDHIVRVVLQERFRRDRLPQGEAPRQVRGLEGGD